MLKWIIGLIIYCLICAMIVALCITAGRGDKYDGNNQG